MKQINNKWFRRDIRPAVSPFTPPHQPPGLMRSRVLATMALAIAALLWVMLLVLTKLWPAHAGLINILSLGAEAGMVGGLADWYAVTVLFRNPFGRLPLPSLMQRHTEIIPRNKERIAESIGRFAQENFLAPAVVRRALQETDVSLRMAEWLCDEENGARLSRLMQRLGPRLLHIFENKTVEDFIQQNAVEWVKNTPINRTVAEMLRAVLENDFHSEALQRALDAADRWIKANPQRARAGAKRVFEELGVANLTRGASWIGIDVQKRIIETFMTQVESSLEDREHPWRLALETFACELMLALKEESLTSARLNAFKNNLADSEAVVKFMSSAVIILRDVIKQDLAGDDSALAANLRALLTRVGQQLRKDEAVRQALNHEIEEVVVSLANDYANAAIHYVSRQIHLWDTREMIAKIETEVGGDLHMIRVNGVVVGAFVGLLLGLARAGIQSLLG
jgi:uncharacterized membrane-anchored protein YjiN (DUF445 family)